LQGKYNLTGVGVATNEQGQVYLTQIFLNARVSGEN
ncbi:MAG: CAP domain-containing protein, partial [Dolichospermum sp.]